MVSKRNQSSGIDSQPFQAASLNKSLNAFGFSTPEISLANGSFLKVLEVVRIVPDKRLVCRCLWNGVNVYAKVFTGRYFKRYAERDAVGVKFLSKSGIKTPALLLNVELLDFPGQALIFAEVFSGINAEQAYQNSSDFYLTAKKLVAELALHHQFNIIQTDLYLKNFLVDGDDIYTLDGDGIRNYKKLNKSIALDNLAVLLSKFDVLEIEAWLPTLLKLYAGARGWKISPNLDYLREMIDRHRTRVASHYADKKVFRQCTDVAVYHNPLYFEAVARRFGLKQPISIEACDALIDLGIRLKSGNTCTVSLATIEGVSVVVKRYNIKSFWHGVGRAFRQTRAAASWANAYRLNILGILTPKPIALIEKRFFGLRGKAYFLSEFIDAPDVKSFFEQIKNKNTETAAIKEIAKLFYQLYLLKLSHGDLKYSNIKMLDGNPCLIDLDSLRQHQWTYFALNGHVHDLRRFMRNWQDQPTLYNTFIKEFSAVYADHQALRLAGLIN